MQMSRIKNTLKSSVRDRKQYSYSFIYFYLFYLVISLKLQKGVKQSTTLKNKTYKTSLHSYIIPLNIVPIFPILARIMQYQSDQK